MRGAAARRLLAASALAGLLVGIPSVLVRLGGWPLPRRLPDAATFDRLLSGRVEVDAAKVIALVAWTAVLPLLAGLAVELVSCVRGMPAPRLPVIGPLQPVLARLVTTAVLTAAPSIPRPALAAVPAPAVVVSESAPPGAFDQVGDEARFAARARPEEKGPSYRVKRFDTFIGIAQELLPGGASRWPELFELNRGMTQPTGRPLLRPEDLEEDAVIMLTKDAHRGRAGSGTPARPPGGRAAGEAAAEWEPVAVSRGDWVSTLVWERVPGASIERVREIVDVVETVNLGRRQPHGGVFEDADSILPGWTVLIPVDASAELGAPVLLPQQEDEERAERVGEAPATSETPPATAPPPRGAATPEGPEARPAEPAAREPGGRAVRLPFDSAVHLVVALGIVGLLARSRVNRRRAYRPSDPAPTRVVGADDDGASRTLHEIARAARRQIGRTRRERMAEPTASSDEDSSAAIDPAALGTLWLHGEGADAAVRGLVVRALVADARPPARVLIDAATGAALLGLEKSVPGLEVLPTADDVLFEVGVERVRRARILEASGAADLAAYQLDPCDEALGLVLAVARPSESDACRWAEVQAGHRLGIGALLVGEAGRRPAGGRAATVDRGGRIEWVEGEAPIAFGALVDLVTPGDLAVLLAAVADERRLRERPEPPVSRVEPFPVGDLDALPAPAGGGPEPEAPFATEAAEPPPPSSAVAVRLLGPFAISVEGRPFGSGLLDKARELLAYLALRPDGARRERILEDLWGDVDPVRRQDRFSAAVSNLRGRIRAGLGDPDLDVVEWHGDRYRLDPRILDVDLWRFHRAISGAQATEDTESKAVELRVAVAAYGGEFAQEAPWEWVEAEREGLRRTALDAAVQLAELERARGRVDEAVHVIERALEIDPYAEYLYVRGVTLLASMGRIESARALYNALAARLEDVDAEPMPETVEAVGSVLAARAREAARLATEEVTRSSGASI